MSIMSELHAALLQVVADAEIGARGFKWVWVPDQLGAPGSEIRILTVKIPVFHKERLAVRVADWDLVVPSIDPAGTDRRTIDGVVVRVGNSVRIFDAEAGRDFEICTVSDALGVFA